MLLYFQTRQIKESLTYHPFWAKCAFNQISNSNGSNKGGLQDEVKVKVNKKVYKVTIKIMNQNIVINRQPISQVTMGKLNEVSLSIPFKWLIYRKNCFSSLNCGLIILNIENFSGFAQPIGICTIGCGCTKSSTKWQ